MAKSKIIKELANGSVDTLTALKRVKVLISEFDNDDLLQWINYEIIGYPEDANLPDYRVTHGNLIGTYSKRSIVGLVTWSNVSIPLGKMPEDIRQQLLQVKFFDSIETLKRLSEDAQIAGKSMGKPLSADILQKITQYNNDPYVIITSAIVEIGRQFISNIFSAVENRLLDILLILEKEFGNLDELDLDTSTKSTEEIKDITNRLCVIVYCDQSVKIGDGNRIKNSDIASKIEKLD